MYKRQVLYGAVFNKSGAPDTIVPTQTYVFTGAKEVPAALTSPSDEGKPGAAWSVAVSYTHLLWTKQKQKVLWHSLAINMAM